MLPARKPADDSRAGVWNRNWWTPITIPAAGPSEGGNAYDSSGGFTAFSIPPFPAAKACRRPCLPTIITLTLALFAAVRFGLLGGHRLFGLRRRGTAVTFFLTVRHLLEGRFFNPWVPHLVTWVVCWLLVAWLSGNLN